MKKAMSVVIWFVPVVIILTMAAINTSLYGINSEFGKLYFLWYIGCRAPLVGAMYAALAIIVVITKKVRKVS